MTSLNLYRGSLVLATVAMLFGAGCTAGMAGATNQVVIGAITFNEMDADNGILRGTYDFEGHSLDFEAVRGEPNPVEEGGPAYAVDTRLCDERGFCFALGAGGHGLADPSWIENRAELVPSIVQSRINHESAMAFHRDLLDLDHAVLQGLDDELNALTALSNFDPPGSFALTPVDHEATPSSGSGSVLVPFSGGYTHHFEIWKHPVYGLPFADHSATRTISLDSGGYWIMSMSTSNHGEYAAASGMNFSCSRDFPNRSVWLAITTACNAPASNGAAHAYGELNCCESTYGITPGHHVCNDDTHLQRDEVVANSTFSAAYCGDAIEAYAPGCY